MVADDNWPAVIRNLRKASQEWASLSRVTGREGGRCPDLRPDVLGSGPVGNALRVRDMGHIPTHREGVGKIPPQGGP